MPNNEKKINWNDKFKEFAKIYARDEKEMELLLKFYSLVKRKSGEFNPSDFEQLYKQIYKKKELEMK